MDKRTRTCNFDGCSNKHKARGLCGGHYKQQREGQELRPLRSQITLEQRFWAKVRKTDDCWEWIAAANGNGYGLIWIDGRARIAHQVAWEIVNGSFPDRMELDHRCGNRACVNPAHLRPTTRSQNMQHRIGNQCNNTSGVRGVYWDKRANAWGARAILNGRYYWGGRHSTIEEADRAARSLRAELFTHDDHDQWVKAVAASPKNDEAA